MCVWVRESSAIPLSILNRGLIEEELKCLKGEDFNDDMGNEMIRTESGSDSDSDNNKERRRRAAPFKRFVNGQFPRINETGGAWE